MIHPFQCLAFAKGGDGQEAHSNSLILAACGPRLLSLPMSNAAGFISSWTAAPTQAAKAVVSVDGNDEGEQPKKKQKIEGDPVNSPAIIKLVVSPDSRHVVAVTDDKCVRVFDLGQEGNLSEISQRTLPKRPCAVQILPDSKTILVGDKFGDVYSLPLLSTTEEDAAAAAAEAEKQAAKAFKPSASNLTVHSKRNLDALKSQMRQKSFTPRKEPLAFAHQLLLGHVSMLTDTLFAQLKSEHGNRTRGYVITADRDEHIRVSRSQPQSHVIEGYCLGHTQFVSKICLVGNEFLVSGGGDDWVGFWDWQKFSLRSKLDIRSAVLEALSTDETSKDNVQIAVSALLSIPVDDEGISSEVIVVACEGVPAIFAIDSAEIISTSAAPAFTILPLEAQPLDLQHFGPRKSSFIVSLDQREDGTLGSQAFHIGRHSNDIGGAASLHYTVVESAELQTLRNASKDIPIDEKTADDLLYGLGNLRKRGGWEPK